VQSYVSETIILLVLQSHQIPLRKSASSECKACPCELARLTRSFSSVQKALGAEQRFSSFSYEIVMLFVVTSRVCESSMEIVGRLNVLLAKG
jgi:hypothetical protein